MGKQYEYEEEDYQTAGSSSSVSSKLTYLLIGGGIGAVVALLFAPKSGNELRGDIADVSRKGMDKTREYGQQLGEKSGTYIEQAKQKAGDVYVRAGDAYTAARDKFSRSDAEQTVESVPKIGGKETSGKTDDNDDGKTQIIDL